MVEKILFVDDEPSVLDGYRRMLRREFEVDTAVGGQEGLAKIHDFGPYSVVISDMRMPGMNGAQFLAQVRKNTPDTIRMLLTGYTDINAAIDAVNEGKIFRFLTKPCAKESLVEAINLGLVEYRSVKAEKELIKKAKIVERATSDSDHADARRWDNFESPTGLPGPSQAKAHLVPRCGVDSQCYVVLFRLPVQQTIEERYGDEASNDYLNFIAQFLMQALRSEDRLFHWRPDVLMAVVQRLNSAFSMRMEMARLIMASREYMIETDGRSIMIANLITFDSFPASQFSTFDDMLVAFDAKLMAKM
ncbi:MAG: response regulator [Terracidiphilus sp.]|jgi:FixJ family two-component response regulator